MKFEEMQRKAMAEWELLQRSGVPNIYVGTATCGRIMGALEVYNCFLTELQQKGVEARLTEVGCLGLCYAEPVVLVSKLGRPYILYKRVTPEIVSQIVADYLANDNPRPDLALGTLGEGKIEGLPDLLASPVFRSQTRIALRNCGLIDPANIGHYIAVGGYTGLSKALQMVPEDVIEEVARSGLRGRGRVGSPTGVKWRLCRQAPGSERYVVCNAAEADPRSYKDRMLLESDPHAVLEGMLIAAYAVGATTGYVCIGGENTLAVQRVKAAIRQMENHGLLGSGILDSSFSFHLEVREVPMSLVVAEETALVRGLEGGQYLPCPRPPVSSRSGQGIGPVVVDDVETFAHVSALLQRGAEWYARCGTQDSTGTKVLTLSGSVARAGIVEVPMGITLREIVYEIGGGGLNGREVKAVQFGGTPGGWMSASNLEVPLTYGCIEAEGLTMGSGAIVVADTAQCLVEAVRERLSYLQAECCGKCVFGREGTFQLLEILTDIVKNRGRPEDIDLLVELSEGMRAGCLCDLGRATANQVLTAVRHFHREFETHARRKKCPADAAFS